MKEKLNIGLIMLIFSLLMGIFSGMSIFELLKSLILVVTDSATLNVVGAIVLILILGNLLNEAGSLRKINLSVETFIKDRRLTLIIPSALMGLLPAPAGAMLSAPVVEESGNKMGLSAEIKTFLNYWFRHVWEYVWPIYPGIILAVAILNVSLQKLIVAQLPLTLAAIFAGVVFGLGKISDKKPEKDGKKTFKGVYEFFLYAWPILAIIFLVLVFKVDLILSLLIIVVFALFITKMDKKRLPFILKNSLSWRMILLIVSVMLFKRILETSGMLSVILGLFDYLKVSSLITLFSIPFFVGFVTGVTPAFVGISLPVLLPIIGTSSPDLTYVMLAYAGGFSGCLLSPVHLCLVVTVQYFKADFTKVYKLVILPVVFVALVAFTIAILRDALG